MKLLPLISLLFGLCLVSAHAEDLSKCMVGWNETQSSHYPVAIASYETCIKDGDLSKASLARTYRNLGITYRRAKQPLKAVDASNKAIALHPTDVVDDYVNRGNAYDEAGDFKRAMADYAKALDIQPGYGEVYYNRGVCYEHQKMYAKAKAEFIAAYDDGLRTHLLYERLVLYGLIKKQR